MKQVGVQTNPSAGVGGSVGASTVVTPIPPAPPAGVNAIVTGAGTAAVNGTYDLVGFNEGYALYQNRLDPLISLNGGAGLPHWAFSNDGGDPIYTSDDNVFFPWLVTTWVIPEFGGNPPVPTVSQG